MTAKRVLGLRARGPLPLRDSAGLSPDFPHRPSAGRPDLSAWHRGQDTLSVGRPGGEGTTGWAWGQGAPL